MKNKGYELLIADKIEMTENYRSGDNIKIPVKYIAFKSEDKIKNLLGEVYTKKRFDNKNTSPKPPKIDENYYYDIIKTNVILDCEDRILDLKRLVFLIEDNLYDIFGNRIDSAEVVTKKTEIKVEENFEDEIIECEFMLLKFDKNVKDENNNVIIEVEGNEKYGEGIISEAFDFDGNTYLKTNFDYLEEFTINFWIKVDGETDKYQSLVSASRDFNNLFNIIRHERDLIFYYDDEKKYEYDIEDDEWTMITIQSNGKIFKNGKLKTTLENIDLSSGNKDFIIGGDWNSDGIVNNFFEGLMSEFGICKKELSEEEIWELYEDKDKVLENETESNEEEKEEKKKE